MINNKDASSAEDIDSVSLNSVLESCMCWPINHKKYTPLKDIIKDHIVVSEQNTNVSK